MLNSNRHYDVESLYNRQESDNNIWKDLYNRTVLSLFGKTWHSMPCTSLSSQTETVICPIHFSKEELSHIFNAADELLLVRRDFSSLIFSIPALLRLLYSTGMRIGEAILLKNRDVDIISRIIVLRDTKNKRERQIPIGETLFQVLDQYMIKRNKLPIPDVNNPNSPFFISLNGKPLGGKTVRYWFLLILKQCHINYVPGVGPRIHDLRHTFAVHALDKLVKEGSDIYCCLPILSVALGHKCVSDTEYYLRITNQVYPDLSEVTSAIAEYIFQPST